MAERAHIGRSTFYSYYEDIYALSEAIQQRLLSAFEVNVSRVLPVLLLKDNLDGAAAVFEPMSEFLRENRVAVLVFMGKNGSAQFMYKMRQLAKKNARGLFAQAHSDYVEYLMEFMVSASFGLMIYWLENDCALSYADLAKIITTIMIKGVRSAAFSASASPTGR